jgi:hypothetical protein
MKNINQEKISESEKRSESEKLFKSKKLSDSEKLSESESGNLILVYKIKNYFNLTNIIIFSISQLIIIISAISLARKCNEGFTFMSFLFALLCPQLYIFYHFITFWSFCYIN